MMLIMSGGLVEFIPQRAYAVDTVHELEVAAPLIVHTGIVDDCVANRFEYLPGDVERHPRIVEPLRPRILIHHPNDRTRLTEHSTDAIEENGLAIREVVKDITDRPLARPVGSREVARLEREALQRLVSSPFKLSNE
jgi:hypothetical protein